ncbi:MAG: xanthine dehydrogenase family protein molybdopterin-binding subunit [Chloroflexi bacterium]|nr:xanthine dehydrogenase family protein molybdopterin-binding subunit [Chloroflexota bacterium]
MIAFSAPPETGSQRRVDGDLKVTGAMPYAADLRVDNALHVAVVRSSRPHARIVRIDTAAARAVPEVACVLTGADVPHTRTGRGMRDVPVLAIDKVRFVGEMVAAVAAADAEIAEQAAALIAVEYEDLPAVFDPLAALEPGAPVIHDQPWTYAKCARTEEGPANLIATARKTAGGDVDDALANADRVFERTFRTQKIHQGYIEPHCCVVYLEAGQKAHVWSCNKSPYALRNQLSGTFDMPVEDILVHSAAIGGDFGGKGSPMDIPLCLEFSRRTGRPVRMERAYSEELQAGDPAPSSVSTIRMGVGSDGRIQAFKMRTLLNAGAYGGFTASAASQFVGGTAYRLGVAESEVTRVYTNEVPNGSFRAPGGMQVIFAVEVMMDEVARQIGLDPVEFRRRNLLTTGEQTINGNMWPEHRGIELLNLAEKSFKAADTSGLGPNVRVGRGVGMYDRPTQPPSRTSMRLRLTADGRLEAEVPIQDTGTGAHSVMQRMLAGALGLSRDDVAIRYVGTDHLPWDSGVGGQRITSTVSQVSTMAADALKEEVARRAPGLTLTEAASGFGPIEVTVETEAPGRGGGAINYCAQICQVAVDVETGQVQVLNFLTAHDVAEIIEPVSHNGQIDGGIAMGVGFALSEDLGIEDGRVTSTHLGDYKLPTMPDMPPLQVVLLPGGKGVGPLNVKSIGEMSNVASAAAIANAVGDAIGACLDTLPLTAERVRAAAAAG